jgi:hypothetical protein
MPDTALPGMVPLLERMIVSAKEAPLESRDCEM